MTDCSIKPTGCPILLAAVSIGLFFAGIANAAPFQHPGTLHTQADFDRMAAKHTTEQPYINGYNMLATSTLSAVG